MRLPTRLADLRALSSAVPERFDVAVVLDNSLAHLLSQDELDEAARQLAATLVPGGLLLASVRDYDAVRAGRPGLTSARLMGSKGARRISFQVWDWDADGERYDFTQYLVCDRPEGVGTLAFRSRVRAISRAALTQAYAAAELTDLAWIEPAPDGFYQPILAARRP